MRDLVYQLSLLWRRMLEYLGILRVVIDIGNEEIRILEAYKFLSYFKVLSMSSERITDTDNIVFVIERFIERFATHPIRRVNLALSSTSIIPLFMSFPGLPREKIQSAILWEIERSIPLPLEEAYFSYKILSRTNEKGTQIWNVMAVVAKRDEVDRYLEAFRHMNILVEEISYLPVNILSALKISDSENATGYISISHHGLELYIMLNKEIINFGHYIGDFRNINSVTIRNIVDYFADFIKKRIAFLEKIIVIGNYDGDVNGIVDSIMDSLNIFTMPAGNDEYKGTIRKSRMESRNFDILGFTYDSFINLHIEPKKIHSLHIKDVLVRAAIIIFLLLDILSFSFIPRIISSHQDYSVIKKAQNLGDEISMDSAVSNMAVTLEQIETLEELKEEHAELMRKIQEIESLGIKASNLKVILAEISRLIPDDVILTSLNIDESDGIMLGTAGSSDGLENFIVYLVNSRVMEDVVLSRADLVADGDNTEIEFKITFEVDR